MSACACKAPRRQGKCVSTILLLQLCTVLDLQRRSDSHAGSNPEVLWCCRVWLQLASWSAFIIQSELAWVHGMYSLGCTCHRWTACCPSPVWSILCTFMHPVIHPQLWTPVGAPCRPVYSNLHSLQPCFASRYQACNTSPALQLFCSITPRSNCQHGHASHLGPQISTKGPG